MYVPAEMNEPVTIEPVSNCLKLAVSETRDVSVAVVESQVIREAALPRGRVQVKLAP